MKILHVAAWWPSRVHPTHGNFVEKHVRLVARHHEVVVVAIQEDYALARGTYEIESSTADGYLATVVYFGRKRQGNFVFNLISRARAYRKGLSQVAEMWIDGPDIVHGHILLDGGVFAALAAYRWQIPFVVAEHSSKYHSVDSLGRGKRLIARFVGRRASFILPVSDHLGRTMVQRHRIHGRYRTVPNVVDTNAFMPAVIKPLTTGLPVRLLHVSNFSPRHKNLPGLLRAFSDLDRRQPGRFALHLAGDGDLAQLAELVKDTCPQTAYVTLSGPHTESEVVKLMQAADGFILFSDYETQGVVLLEALACGVPCIATRVGGIPEFLTDGQNGYLVSAGDEAGLMRAMERLADLKLLDSREEIRRTAEVYCSEVSVYRRLEELYQIALARPA